MRHFSFALTDRRATWSCCIRCRIYVACHRSFHRESPTTNSCPATLIARFIPYHSVSTFFSFLFLQFIRRWINGISTDRNGRKHILMVWVFERCTKSNFKNAWIPSLFVVTPNALVCFNLVFWVFCFRSLPVYLHLLFWIGWPPSTAPKRSQTNSFSRSHQNAIYIPNTSTLSTQLTIRKCMHNEICFPHSSDREIAGLSFYFVAIVFDVAEAEFSKIRISSNLTKKVGVFGFCCCCCCCFAPFARREVIQGNFLLFQQWRRQFAAYISFIRLRGF